jgi:hypothetical protein
MNARNFLAALTKYPVALAIVGSALAVLIAIAPPATASMFTLSPDADSRLLDGTYADSPSGSQIYLSVYNYSQPASKQRTVIHFDLSTLPPDMIVCSATLKLTRNLNDNAAGRPMDIYRLTKAFDEATVTWNEASSGDSWTVPGAADDAVGTSNTPLTDPYATDSSNSETTTWDITQLVNEWYNGTPNLGLLILSEPQGNQTHWASKESSPGPELKIMLAETAHECTVPVDESTWGKIKALYQ